MASNEHVRADERRTPSALRRRRDEMRRQLVQAPVRVLSGVIGALPVQTREHLRTCAREGVLAVESLFDALSAAGVRLVDRIFAEPRTPPVSPPVDPKDAPTATSASPSPTTSASRASTSGT